jgi:glutaredoxin
VVEPSFSTTATLNDPMREITLYGTPWCGDCRRAKKFLRERGVAFHEVDIDEAPEAEALVIRVNDGRRKLPTIEVEGRYFACSPFDPNRLAEELKIPLHT